MFQLESRPYSQLQSNIWNNVIDLFTCIQGHMFWIYSAIFCLWEESNSHPLCPLENVKISSRPIAPIKPASQSTRSSEQPSKTKSSQKKPTMQVSKGRRSMGRSHDSASSPCLINSVDYKSKANVQADSTAGHQRNKRDQWQATISQIIKRREPKNQVSPLQHIRTSASTPSLLSSYQTEQPPVPYKKIPRRSTAPSISRTNDWRPSIHEERHGITKPPKWWRKMTMGPWKRRNSA
jgi:hypothetical protein